MDTKNNKSKIYTRLFVYITILLAIAGCTYQRYYYFNLKDAKCMKEIRILYVIPVYRHVMDTPFSLLLKRNDISLSSKSDWALDSSFSPGCNVSPHYAYHGILADADCFARHLSDIHMSKEEEMKWIKLECERLNNFDEAHGLQEPVYYKMNGEYWTKYYNSVKTKPEGEVPR